MLCLALKTIAWQKMRREWVNAVPGFTQTKFLRLCARKMIKGTQLNFEKRCFIELNCLAIKRHERIQNDVSSASLSDCYIPST